MQCSHCDGTGIEPGTAPRRLTIGGVTLIEDGPGSWRIDRDSTEVRVFLPHAGAEPVVQVRPRDL